MIRSLSFSSLASVSVAILLFVNIGCVSPYGGHCDCGQCDGISHNAVPHSPFQQWRKSLICGDGCGEVYYGDYINNPPDCCDPCDNMVQCTPPIQARPGLLLLSAATGLYGKRVPQHDACGCGGSGCGDCSMAVDCGCGGESYGGCSSCAMSGQQIMAYPATDMSRAPLSGYSVPGGSSVTHSRQRGPVTAPTTRATRSSAPVSTPPAQPTGSGSGSTGSGSRTIRR